MVILPDHISWSTQQPHLLDQLSVRSYHHIQEPNQPGGQYLARYRKMTDQLDQQQNQMKDEPRTNLIINYLPQSMTEKDLYSLFVTIGPVESCRVMKDYKVGRDERSALPRFVYFVNFPMLR